MSITPKIFAHVVAFHLISAGAYDTQPYHHELRRKKINALIPRLRVQETDMRCIQIATPLLKIIELRQQHPQGMDHGP